MYVQWYHQIWMHRKFSKTLSSRGKDCRLEICSDRLHRFGYASSDFGMKKVWEGELLEILKRKEKVVEWQKLEFDKALVKESSSREYIKRFVKEKKTWKVVFESGVSRLFICFDNQVINYHNECLEKMLKFIGFLWKV